MFLIFSLATNPSLITVSKLGIGNMLSGWLLNIKLG